MIVDFQHHFTPRELIKEDPGDRLVVHFDENGAPSYTVHSLLYDLDEHIRMMDYAGIDAAFLTSASAMCADLDRSRGDEGEAPLTRLTPNAAFTTASLPRPNWRRTDAISNPCSTRARSKW